MVYLNRAVFLDRDGVINEDLLTNKGRLKLFPMAAAAVKKLNDLGFLTIIITNQPQVAKGVHREADVRKTNTTIVRKLKKFGAIIDAVYYCPHHPEQREDIPSWAKKYRVICKCRKPRIGMLNAARKKFDIDFLASYFIGDRTVDVQCGKTAGCKTILVRTGYAGKDGKYTVKADYECDDILDAAKLIENLEAANAVILAGGRGDRLRPLTDVLPKPLLPISGRPVLEHQIELLKKHGIKYVAICGHYLFNKIRDYFGDGSQYGVNISYLEEKEPLGTGGAIKNVESLIRNRFIVLYGDEMLDINISKLMRFHLKNKGIATIVLHETTHPEDSDLVLLDKKNRIRKLLLKPHKKIASKISKSSLYVFEPAVFSFLPRMGSFETALQKMIKTNRVFGYVTDEYIKDMGTFERYEQIKKRYESAGSAGKKAQA